jgi:hypothetical protein
MPHGLSGNFDDEKVPLAIAATRTFAIILQQEGHDHWASRIESIAQTLEGGDIREAVLMFEKSSRGTMGSLSDIYPGDSGAFDTAWGEYSRALERLRQKLKRSGEL